jgi:thiol-disulfide isomerase/thioredoxin
MAASISGGNKMIIYYNPFCLNCKKILETVWNPVKESKKYPNLNFEEINCKDNPVSGIIVLPTILLEIGDQKINYNETIGHIERTIESLENFISGNLEKASQNANSSKEQNNNP